MVGSMDSLDFCTELPVTEKNAIALDCWNNICLSNIWIPSHLLPNRSKPSNTRATQGVYHTLEKKDLSKYKESFSVYSSLDVDSEQGEIFISDSDEDIFRSDPTSLEKIETVPDNKLLTVARVGSPLSNECGIDIGNNTETDISTNGCKKKKIEQINPKKNLNVTGKTLYLDDVFYKDCEKGRKVISSEENLIDRRKNLEDDQNAVAKNFSNSDITECQDDFKNEIIQGTMSKKIIKDTDSFISLNEILDVTPEVNIKDFKYDLKKRDESDLLSCDKKERNSKKSKKDKGKKSSKYIRLDKFLEGTAAMSQDDYCDKYFQNIFKQKYKNGNFSNLSIESKAEFPDLATEELKFIHSDKKIKETECEVSFYDIKSDLNKSEKIKEIENNIDVEEIKPSMTDTNYGKIVIENIPSDVTKDSISIILHDYGEIKNLSLISAGKFLTAHVEIDLFYDIDWIIDCLNGSELFGASSKKLLCYKQ